MRITKLWDKLRTSGDNLEDKELVMTTLNGSPYPNHKWSNQVAQI